MSCHGNTSISCPSIVAVLLREGGLRGGMRRRVVGAYPLRFQLQGVAVASFFPVIHCMFCCASAAAYVTTYKTDPQVLQHQERCCVVATCACATQMLCMNTIQVSNRVLPELLRSQVQRLEECYIQHDFVCQLKEG